MWIWLVGVLVASDPPHQGFRAHALELLRQDTLTVLHLVGGVRVDLGPGQVALAHEAYYTEAIGHARLVDSVEVRFPWGTVRARLLEYWQPLERALFRDSVVVEDTAGRRLRAHQMVYRRDTAWLQRPRLWDPHRQVLLRADTGYTVGDAGWFWRNARVRWRDSTWILAETLRVFADTLEALGHARLENPRFRGNARRLKITERWLQLSDSARTEWTGGTLQAGRIQVHEEEPEVYRVWGLTGAELRAPGEEGILTLQADTLELRVERDTLRWLQAWPTATGEYRETPREQDGTGSEDP